MIRVILFDVNETLLDLTPLQPVFQRVFGDPAVLQQWFSFLLHSTVVTTLTSTYSDMGHLANTALAMVAARRQVALAESDRNHILTTMRSLPPHTDVKDNLQRLKDQGFRLAPLTNSSPQMVDQQIANAGLASYFERWFSVDSVGSFKPDAAPYQMAADQLGVKLRQTRMVAAHDWDILGALKAGCKGAYIARNNNLYNPAYPKPDIMATDLYGVTDQILQCDR